MSKPFDPTLKQLVETRPRDGLTYVGLAVTGPVAVIDADLSTISAEADKVIHVGGDHPWLAHIEFQTSYERLIGDRLLRYNVLLSYRHLLPVDSTVVLLRPQADGPALTGQVVWQVHDRPYLDFRYRVVRAWQQSVDSVLAGGLGTLPLAPLCDVPLERMPDVIRQMEARLRQEVPPAEAAVLWTATYLLMGLRYPPGLAEHLLQGVRAMEESSTYQALLSKGRALGRDEGRNEGRLEGRLAEARSVVLRQGRKKFGAPLPAVLQTVEAIADLARLEELSDKLLDVDTWDDLMAS